MTHSGSRRDTIVSNPAHRPGKKIGLIACNGQFPLLLCEAAKRKGYAVYAAAYVGEADPGLGVADPA